MKEEEKVPVSGSAAPVVEEVIPLPEPVELSLKANNKFLMQFLPTYNYKQRSELRVSSIRSMVSITGTATSGVANIKFKFIIELEKSSEMMILRDEQWGWNKDDLDKPGFVGSVVSKVNASYYNLMRHGLATVIRTAQKKGVNVII